MNASTPPTQVCTPGTGLPLSTTNRAGEPAQQPMRRLDSRSLLGQDREVEIDHGGQLYRLRLTSLGKLILTK